MPRESDLPKHLAPATLRKAVKNKRKKPLLNDNRCSNEPSSAGIYHLNEVQQSSRD